MTFMFYMELYWQSALTSFIFFMVNLSYSLSMELLGYATIPGLSYLYGGIAASCVSLIILLTTVKTIDQRIFANYN